jgi:hypothetical protein
MFSNFLSENRAVYEIMWKIIAETDSPQMVILRMRIAFWIPKATNTQSQSEYAINITFPREKKFLERASVATFVRTCPLY